MEVVPLDRAGDIHGVELPGEARALARRGLTQVMVEGGSQINGAMLASGLATDFTLFVRPLLLGAEGVPLATFTGERHKARAELELIDSMNLPAQAEEDWNGLLALYRPA